MNSSKSLAPFRVLVAGSEEWTGSGGGRVSHERNRLVHGELDRILAGLAPGRGMVVVHGTRGPADSAYWWVCGQRRQGAPVSQDIHLARGDDEGHERMVAGGADVCLVFTRDGGGRTAELAAAAGIPVRRLV